MPAIKPTTYQDQIKIFEAAGCRYVRTHGDHLIYSYPGAIRPVVIPKYQEVPAFIIKNNMKVIGMTRDQYFQLLENI
ncbi:MAG: type II toxin-antitoxin system HicA family toxin [Desulfobacteraceae bacterium]|nr:MAG: type II toxin-antitoxin system HicA family toxin [Desulfobacteraceae bacterium]